MSAPRVFKGREEEVTIEELASLGAAAAKSANEGSGDEEIPLIKSDITSNPAAEAQPVIAETKKRKVGRPPKANRAVKKLKWTGTVNSSQSAAPSAEESSSSPHGTPDSPSLTIRKVSKVGEHSQTVPAQRLMPVAQMHSSPQEPTQSETDANVRDCDKEDATPKPVSIPRGRGGPRKKQTPIPVNTTGKDSVRTTRATARSGSEKAASDKVPQAKAAPAKGKRPSTTYGRGVGRPKKTPSKAKSATPQFTKEEYVVEKIVDSRVDSVTKEHMYMVKWKGYGTKDNTWEPMKNLGKCSSLIKTFTNSQKAKGKGKK